MDGKEIIQDAVKTIRSGQCKLLNSELIDKCEKWTRQLCETKGAAWPLRVPVDFNHDPDMVFSELIERFKESQYTIAKIAKEIESKKNSIEYLESFIEFCKMCHNPKDDCICN